VTSKARVLSKPEPTYTEAARKNQITGTVVLRAVFSSGGISYEYPRCVRFAGWFD
jgi:hypothetical protein